MSDVQVGDKVVYHGSLTKYHDKIYEVRQLPRDGDDRGYLLVDTIRPRLEREAIDPGDALFDVHKDSFTKVVK